MPDVQLSTVGEREASVYQDVRTLERGVGVSCWGLDFGGKGVGGGGA